MKISILYSIVRNSLLCLTILLISNIALGAIYYVDATNGNDQNPGISPSDAWQSIAKINSLSIEGKFVPNDSILFKNGEVWNEELRLHSQGTVNNPIRFSSYGDASVGNPIIWSIVVYSDSSYTVFENIIVDHNKQPGDAFRVKAAKGVTLRNMDIRNGINDGVDVYEADGLLIDSCHIHHFLAGSYNSQKDAHGFIAADTDGITIRSTEIHHVSGDAFQTDPDRDTDTPDNILIEKCVFWTGPLTEDFNDGWVKTDNLPGDQQQIPSENAIDTKMVTSGWEDDILIPRMRITIRDSVFYGWKKGTFITNRAVFNLKEKIEAIVEGVTVYDCEIAFRLRGTRGNANVTITNSVIYNSDIAIRAEDNLSNLKIYNSTFGDTITSNIVHAGGSGGVGTWNIENNAFVNQKPQEAFLSTNIIASNQDFVDISKSDYHLTKDSILIDKGKTLSTITIDRDGNQRTIPYDVGAFERDTTPPSRPKNLRVLE